MTSDETWSVATAEHDQKPLIFRIRNQPPSFARKEAFPHLLAVSWPYESPNQQGMPSDKDSARMGRLEDLLGEAFEGAGEAFLTVVVTGLGVRQWQWYARNPDDAMKLVNETLGKQERFPVEFGFQEDPEWVGYSRFLGIG